LLLFQHQITSQNLLFKEVLPSHQKEWEKLFDSPATASFLGLDPQASPKELAQKFMDKVFHRYKHKLGGMNALIEKSSGQLVGQCGLLIQEWQGRKFWEVGYAILPLYRGKGYAAEAAIRSKEIAFETNLCQELFSIINVGNVASEKVAMKNEMKIHQHIPDYNGSEVNLWRVAK
jgi:RimJ/RimL family protein N-acetyltransferase